MYIENQKDMRKLFEEILEVRELQQNSKKTYLGCFDAFEKACITMGETTYSINRNKIISYLSTIKSESTKIQAISVIKMIYMYCIHKPENIANLPKVKKHFHVVDYLTTKEISDIISVTKNTKHKLMLRMQYLLALRVSELCSIRKKDFVKHWDGNTQQYVYDLRINGKGG